MRSTLGSINKPKDGASSKVSILKTHHFNTDTYNALSQLPKHLKQSIIREGEVLVNAPQWCEEIWKTMRKNDFATKGALNLPIIETIYNAHARQFEKMLNLTNGNELFEIMDADEDGIINEDEQVLIFSVIKEKMIKIADDLCHIQEYIRYRDLMKSVRKLEVQISRYQDLLRQKIYQSEMNIYHQIGESRFEEFYEYYEEEFKEFNTYSLERTAQLRAQHEDQLNNLIDKLDRAVVALKFKPKTQLKEYQTQEKLVSIDERVEEAMNFRKELKDLEVSEAQRINRLRMENIEKQRNKLLIEQSKEMKHLESKLSNEENKLIIRMNRDFDVLKKKTHLHENEIKKIQGLAATYALQKALNDGELKRMKAKSKKMNDILVSVQGTSNGGLSPVNKSPVTLPPFSSHGKGPRGSQFHNSITLNSTDMTNKTNVEFAKSLVKSQNVISFHLKKSYGEEPPVNVKPVNYANEDKLSHKKVEIYLVNKIEKKDEIPPLTSLYDEFLRPVERTVQQKGEKMTAEEKKRTRQFINEKLNGDRKSINKCQVKFFFLSYNGENALSLIHSILSCIGGGDLKAGKTISTHFQKTRLETRIDFPNGNKYVGEVKQGQLDGHGILYYKNGNVYNGEWKQNKKNGFATQFYQKEKKKYVGYWKDNLFHGEGTIFYADGSRFVGNFVEGEKHGPGKYIDVEGDEFDEEWEHGHLDKRLLQSSQKNEDNSPYLKSKRTDTLKEEEDNENEKKAKDNENSGEEENDKKKSRGSMEMDKEFDEKQLHSNILFKSQNDFESGEGGTYDVGFETLNIIEHIDMLNSAAGTLLNKDVSEWSIEEVSDWLKHLGLDEYIEIFKTNHIDGAVLFELTETDLKNEFKITSIGHRKNFMKAVANLKKIFLNGSGKNSDYIKQKIQKFYEKNKTKNRMGIFNSLGNVENRFYSHKFYTKNIYNSNTQIIEESDENSVKFDTNRSNPSPNMNAQKSQEDLDSIVLSGNRKNARENSSDEDKNKGKQKFESDEEIKPPRPKPVAREDSKSSKGKSSQSRQDLSHKQESPGKRYSSSEKKETKDKQKHEKYEKHEEAKSDNNNTEQQGQKNEVESSSESSSETSSESESSDEEKRKKDEEKAKEKPPPVAANALKVVKPDQRVEKKQIKKSSNNFRSAEFGNKQQKSNKYYKESNNKKQNGKRDIEHVNQKIKENIIRKFKESGLNENFIIDYSELFFDKKIGEGGYGRVYLGKFSGIEVAIKDYGKRKLVQRCAEEFVKEVEVISNLRHPNIVLYMGACIHKGKYLMITEYLEEGSLFDHLHKKHTKISDDVLFNIIEDIALGMCYLHGRKVLHCDLKSSNILIDSNWDVKLCDFGLSRVKYKSDRKRFAKQRVGTPHWMAPEILRGEKYDEFADVYSFGMILWEIMAGEIPFKNVPINDIISTVGFERKQLPLPTKGNPLLLSILKSCLSLDKSGRPTFKEIVGQLQQRNKGALVPKKNDLFNFFGN